MFFCLYSYLVVIGRQYFAISILIYSWSIGFTIIGVQRKNCFVWEKKQKWIEILLHFGFRMMSMVMMMMMSVMGFLVLLFGFDALLEIGGQESVQILLRIGIRFWMCPFLLLFLPELSFIFDLPSFFLILFLGFIWFRFGRTRMGNDWNGMESNTAFVSLSGRCFFWLCSTCLLPKREWWRGERGKGIPNEHCGSLH